MDEKGIMLGVIGKTRCVIPKEQKKQYMTQPGDREWATLTELYIYDRLGFAYMDYF
jgi:hypothetical protein